MTLLGGWSGWMMKTSEEKKKYKKKMPARDKKRMKTKMNEWKNKEKQYKNWIYPIWSLKETNNTIS